MAKVFVITNALCAYIFILEAVETFSCFLCYHIVQIKDIIILQHATYIVCCVVSVSMHCIFSVSVFMVALCNRADHNIFMLFLSSFFFLFFLA